MMMSMGRIIVVLIVLMVASVSHGSTWQSWSFDHDFDGWRSWNWQQCTARNGLIGGRTDRDCQLLSPKLDIQADDYSHLLVMMRSDIGGVSEVFFAAPSAPLSDQSKVTHRFRGGRDFTIQRIALSNAPGWDGRIERIRFDALATADAQVTIDWIALVPAAQSQGVLINGGAELLNGADVVAWSRHGRATVIIDQPYAGERALRVASADAHWQSERIDVSMLGAIELSMQVRGAATVTARYYGVTDQLLAEVKQIADPSGNAWQAHTMRFDTPRRAAYATLSFSTADAQAACDFDEIVVTLGEPGPINGEEIVATVEASYPDAAPGFPQAQITTIDGLACVLVNGERISPTRNLFRRPDELHLRNAISTDTQIWQIWLSEAGMYADGFDFAKVDRTINAYLQAKPDALLIVNTMFDGRFHEWWPKQHPQAVARLENGSTNVGGYHGGGEGTLFPSTSSTTWRQAYAEMLRRLVQHMKNAPYASRIIGVQPCAGISEEWFHWGAHSGHLVDYSDEGQADFRRWLRDKYGHDAALQAAWNDGDVTLETAAVPSENQRRNSSHGMFFDPATQQSVLDYNRYQHDVVTQTILDLCKVVKDESDGRLLCGAYFGYTAYLAEAGKGFNQGSGHYSLGRALESDLLDYCIGPIGYDNRSLGEAPTSMALVESFALNGKLWMDLADVRTHWVGLDHPVGYYGTTPDVKGTIEAFRRETARALAQGSAVEWYGFSKGWTFGDERLTDEITHLERIYRTRSEAQDWPLSDYLAVIVDERQIGTFNPFTPPYDKELVMLQRAHLARSGVPWRAYLLSDLMKHPHLLEHRAFVMSNMHRLDDEQRAFIRDMLMKDGRTVAFVGPVGYLSDAGFSAEYASDILGLPMRDVMEPTALHATFLDQLPTPWSQCSGTRIGTRTQFAPVLLPDADHPGVLATLSDTNQPAIIFDKRRDVNVFWSAAPGLAPQVLRALADVADIPVISRDDQTIYAGRGYVGIHAAADGRYTLRLPAASGGRELIHNQTFPAETRQVTFDMRRGETRIYLCIPPSRSTPHHQ